MQASFLCVTLDSGTAVLKFINEGNDVMIICKEKVLRIDFNGPLADMREATRLALEIVTGLIISPEEFVGSKSEILHSKRLYFPRGSGPRRYITEKDWEAAKAYIYDGQNFSSHVKPRRGIVDSLDKLSLRGWSVHIVTSCRGMTTARLWEWVNLYGVSVVSVNKSKDKFPYYSQGGVVFDDEFKHIEPILGVKAVTPILLFDPDKHSPVAREKIHTLKEEGRLKLATDVSEEIEQLLAA